MSFAIETGVPIPKKGSSRLVYPFGKMNVGDSFFIPNGCANSLNSCARNALGRGNYVIRKCTVSGVTGMRVWRTA